MSERKTHAEYAWCGRVIGTLCGIYNTRVTMVRDRDKATCARCRRVIEREATDPPRDGRSQDAGEADAS